MRGAPAIRLTPPPLADLTRYCPMHSSFGRRMKSGAGPTVYGGSQLGGRALALGRPGGVAVRASGRAGGAEADALEVAPALGACAAVDDAVGEASALAAPDAPDANGGAALTSGLDEGRASEPEVGCPRSAHAPSATPPATTPASTTR